MASAGPLAIGGLVIGALLAYFWEGDAGAKPKYPVDVIDNDDKLGLAEANKLGAIIENALASCGDVTIGPDGFPAPDDEGGGVMGGCDTQALRNGAQQILATTWHHPKIAALAAGEAAKLKTLADEADGAQDAYNSDGAMLAKLAKQPCSQITKACANQLYLRASQIRSYVWKTQVKSEALSVAASFEAAAKDIEDAIAAKAAAEKSYPNG